MFYPITEHTLKTDLYTSGYLQCGKQTEPLLLKKGISMFCFKFISFLSAHRRAAPVLVLWLLTSALLVACASKPLPQVATVVADQTQVAASLHKLFNQAGKTAICATPNWPPGEETTAMAIVLTTGRLPKRLPTGLVSDRNWRRRARSIVAP
jgi:hypothetical protein